MSSYFTWNGETRSVSEWASDPRCLVSEDVLGDRLYAGWPVGVAMATPTFDSYDSPPAVSPHRREVLPNPELTAYGETKPLESWLKDPRCEVHEMLLRNRLERGWEPEAAMRPRAGRRLIKAFDEYKTISQWARDPRNRVSHSLLTQRLRMGWEPERAITEPPYGKKRAKVVEAFGESKTLKEWSEDPRCEVTVAYLYTKLRQGIPLEEAMKTCPSKRGGRAKNDTRKRFSEDTQVEIFGEAKTIRQWVADPRCRVNLLELKRNLEVGISPELALGFR